jgi:hypothetical protein
MMKSEWFKFTYYHGFILEERKENAMGTTGI